MIYVRYAEFRDRESVAMIRTEVLEADHPYHYENNIGQGGCLNMVAEEDNRVVGFISVLLAKFQPEGKTFWGRVCPYVGFEGVLPQYQGKGIGKLLLTTAIDKVLRFCPNQPYLYLEHDPTNRPARRLYDRTGFVEMNEESILEVAGITSKSVVMRYRLIP